VQHDDGVPVASELYQYETFGGEDAWVAYAVAQNRVEVRERVVELAGFAQCVGEIDACGQPGSGVCFVLLRELDGAAEELDGFGELVLVEEGVGQFRRGRRRF
jgi:hypothetical protein